MIERQKQHAVPAQPLKGVLGEWPGRKTDNPSVWGGASGWKVLPGEFKNSPGGIYVDFQWKKTICKAPLYLLLLRFPLREGHRNGSEPADF